MFQKAQKSQSKLRMALIGPSGAGKTLSSLAIASGLGSKIAVIDTEHGSASKYADMFEFDCCNLESFHPQEYIKAIQAAGVAGYDVLIIDSLSHAWNGKDGALELVNQAAKRSQGNTYMAWKDITPLQNQLIEAILQSPCHVIATMRAKTEYVQEEYTDGNGRKKTRPVKIGLAPVQRDQVEYEFDIVGDMTVENSLIVSKSRCMHLSGSVIDKPSKELGETLKAWLTDGAPMPERINRDNVMTAVSTELKRLQWDATTGKAHLEQTYGKSSRQSLTDAQLVDFLEFLKEQATAA